MILRPSSILEPRNCRFSFTTIKSASTVTATGKVAAKRFASSYNNPVNHYETLGLSPATSQREIRTKYRELSKKYHPDLNTSLPEDEKKSHSEKFIKITKSYEVLSNKDSKRKYDAELNHTNIHNGSVRLSEEQEARRAEFHQRYYGSNGNARNAYSGLNSTRNRVMYGNGNERGGHAAGNASQRNNNIHSIFNGEFRDHTVNDVPHFDYEKHLRKNRNVDRRFSETHSYKNNDYMLHFMKNRYQPQQQHQQQQQRRSSPQQPPPPNSGAQAQSRRGNAFSYSSAAYGSRTFQDELHENDQAFSNKAPIFFTVLTAVTMFYFISKGNGHDNTAHNDSTARKKFQSRT